ncbi:MAG TPA: bifunctional precorrin-2 dehydrogenase/sirohydrochlorin ferrochelatase [Acidimicrobiales bacterium]|nr:bifunctional precorrin-2 dehydrogenase/sirohydrochlorin ferrochelatase [Acidimicrobiales bacterium]
MALTEALYPVNLVLTGRRCLVVGGGRVAARKVAGLQAAEADVVVVALTVGPEVRATGVPWEERPYRSSDLDGVWLAVTATDDREVNRQVHDDGEAAGVWVNAADDPDSCSFVLPAVVRQGPVMVTIGTAGRSPALASWLKEHVAAELGPEVADLARLLSDIRERIRAEGRSTEDVDWRSALDWSMLEEIKAGQTARVRERLEACLLSS